MRLPVCYVTPSLRSYTIKGPFELTFEGYSYANPYWGHVQFSVSKTPTVESVAKFHGGRIPIYGNVLYLDKHGDRYVMHYVTGKKTTTICPSAIDMSLNSKFPIDFCRVFWWVLEVFQLRDALPVYQSGFVLKGNELIFLADCLGLTYKDLDTFLERMNNVKEVKELCVNDEYGKLVLIARDIVKPKTAGAKKLFELVEQNPEYDIPTVYHLGKLVDEETVDAYMAAGKYRKSVMSAIACAIPYFPGYCYLAKAGLVIRMLTERFKTTPKVPPSKIWMPKKYWPRSVASSCRGA